MSKELKQKALKIIQNRVVANMLGPGADSWGKPETELLSASPIVRYQTGILFPNKYLTPANEFNGSENEEEDREDKIEIDFDASTIKKPDSEKDEDDNENESRFTQDLSTSAFYPDSIGLSFSVAKSSQPFKLVFKGGLYKIPKSSERRVPCTENIFNQIFDNNFSKLRLEERLILEDGFLTIKEVENEEAETRDRHPLSETVRDYFRSIRNQQPDHPALHYQALVTKLVGRAYIRVPFTIEITSWAENEILDVPTSEQFRATFPDLKLQYHIRHFTQKDSGKVHYRVQLINSSESPSKNESSPQRVRGREFRTG
jgi:hypothetical protein